MKTLKSNRDVPSEMPANCTQAFRFGQPRPLFVARSFQAANGRRVDCRKLATDSYLEVLHKTGTGPPKTTGPVAVLLRLFRFNSLGQMGNTTKSQILWC